MSDEKHWQGEGDLAVNSNSSSCPSRLHESLQQKYFKKGVRRKGGVSNRKGKLSKENFFCLSVHLCYDLYETRRKSKIKNVVVVVFAQCIA